ncbi:hypothetical protein AAMO2058_001381100 [Amorphochlora amoebiformis]
MSKPANREANAKAHDEAKGLANAKVVVICGPSAVGKGTLLGMLRKKYPDLFGVAVSHTTRAPRPGEVDGKHYHFPTKEEFTNMKEKGMFLEYANVHGKYYGTSKAAVAKVCEKGGICILEIDVQGANTIKKSMGVTCSEKKAEKKSSLNAKFLFITTSGGIKELERRLRGRGTESEDKIQKRLKTSKKELAFLEANPKFFDKVLKNDDLDTAADELSKTFASWFPTSFSKLTSPRL